MFSITQIEQLEDLLGEDELERFIEDMVSLGKAYTDGDKSGVKIAMDLLAYLESNKEKFTKAVPEYTFNGLMVEIAVAMKQIEAL